MNYQGYKKINICDFQYELPEDRIAQYPVRKRDESKLLIYNKGKVSEDLFRNISQYIPDDSLLVFNNTRVICARLLFRKESGAAIEILCLEPISPSSYEKSFSATGSAEWKCMVGNLKKWKRGSVSLPFSVKGKNYTLSAHRTGAEGDAWKIQFSWEPGYLTFGEVISGAGHLPLPPYIKREDSYEDLIRYQTIYSTIPGSVAAPTAGLHFTSQVLDEIRKKGIGSTELTLHVGAGTFQPVRHGNVLEHRMHREYFSVTEDTLRSLLQYEDRIIPVGTTSVRTLETLYWLGVRCAAGNEGRNDDFFTGQWEPYLKPSDITFHESLHNLLKKMRMLETTMIFGSTEIMIIPGYKFRTLRGMITNFHQPGSTLLLLVAAFTGENWKNIYSYALENKFRFLSYGDSSLLMK